MKEGTCQFCHRQSTLGYNRARQRLLPRYNYKQITVRTSTSYYASYHTASAEGEFTTQPNEAEQRGGDRLLACCCVPDQRKGVHYLGTIETTRDGERDTGHTAPFFLLSSRIAAAAGPASPHGHCWAVRGRRSRSSPFSPPALAVCLVYCLHTVCRMGHWVGPPFTVDTHANAIQARPRPPKKPKPKESLALVHRSYNRERERE